MKRLVGTFIVIALIGGAVWIGLASGTNRTVMVDDVHGLGNLLSSHGFGCDSVETAIPGMLNANNAEVGICRVRNEPATLYAFASTQEASIHRLRYQEGTDVGWIIGPNWTVALRGPRLAADIAEQLRVDVLVDEHFLNGDFSHERSELECPPGDLVQETIADYGLDARGYTGEPEDAVRVALTGLRPGDEIRVKSHDFGSEAYIYRYGFRAGWVEVGWTGSGWLIGSSSTCATSGIHH